MVCLRNICINTLHKGDNDDDDDDDDNNNNKQQQTQQQNNKNKKRQEQVRGDRATTPFYLSKCSTALLFNQH